MNWREAIEMYVFAMAVVVSGLGMGILVINDHPYLALGLLPLVVGLCVFGSTRISDLD